MQRLFWVRLDTVEQLYMGGCGVTAYDETDVATLLAEAGIRYDIVSIEIVESPSAVDANHVAPNAGNFLKRGIWWPPISGWSD